MTKKDSTTSAPTITVYSTMSCPYCFKLKDWLKDNGFAYEDVLVDKDPAAAQKMVQMSGQMGVPFTTVADGEKMHGVLGFNVPALSQLLGISN